MLGRGPRLLRRDQLPTGFVYPDDLASTIRSTSLPAWEWLEGSRLQRAAERLWQHHPRLLVPVAVRRGTTFLVCLVAVEEGHGAELEVVTVDAVRGDAEPVQHLPSLSEWVVAATREAPSSDVGGGLGRDDRPPAGDTGDDRPPPPDAPNRVGSPEALDDQPGHQPGHQSGDPPDGLERWVPPEKGRCACFKHLDDVSLTPIPYGVHAPGGLGPRTVADLVMAGQLRAEPDHPGPDLRVLRVPMGPFHWRAGLGEEARLHLDDDGRTRIEYWLMGNPGVEMAVRGELGDIYLQAPTLCRDGVLTLLGRALLDDRLRKRRRRR